MMDLLGRSIDADGSFQADRRADGSGPFVLTRRQLLQAAGAFMATAALGSTEGCAAAPVAGAVVGEAVSTNGILTLLAVGVIGGFGEQLAEEISDVAPGFAHKTVDALRRMFDDGAPDIWGRYNGDEPVPSQSLRSLAAGAQFSNEDGNLRAVVVHDVADGRRLELPAIVQVGLNFLMRIEAGDKGMLLGPPVGISAAAFRRALRRLRAEYAVVNYDAIDGGDCYLNKPGKYEVANGFGRTMRFTWTPAYPRTAISSSLVVQKGRVLAGKEPKLPIDQTIGLSYDLLFGQGPTPSPQS